MTQAVRRMKRTSFQKTALWRGVAVSVAVTAGLVILFAVIIGFFDVGDGVIQAVNQLIKVTAIFLGVYAIVPRGDENGIRRGVLVGLIYMGVGVLLYALITRQPLTLLGYGVDLLMGLAAGGLSGMILGGMRGK